jgi:hypothetical protein
MPLKILFVHIIEVFLLILKEQQAFIEIISICNIMESYCYRKG